MVNQNDYGKVCIFFFDELSSFIYSLAAYIFVGCKLSSVFTRLCDSLLLIRRNFGLSTIFEFSIPKLKMMNQNDCGKVCIFFSISSLSFVYSLAAYSFVGCKFSSFFSPVYLIHYYGLDVLFLIHRL